MRVLSIEHDLAHGITALLCGQGDYIAHLVGDYYHPLQGVMSAVLGQSRRTTAFC